MSCYYRGAATPQVGTTIHYNSQNHQQDKNKVVKRLPVALIEISDLV